MKVGIAIPGYDRSMVGLFQLVAQMARHPDWIYNFYNQPSSLLTANFNDAWCWALNLREQHDLDYFMMMHSDVRARQLDWFDVMLDEMDRAKADIVSAIIPIKDMRGLTSTAFDTDLWAPQRLTTKQMLKLPKCWTAPNLLFNTGLMLVDFRNPWVEKVCFTINDRIVRNGPKGGWRCDVESEDWNFSRQCHRLGLRCYVTRSVVVDHYGSHYFSNNAGWGEERDETNYAAELDAFDITELPGIADPRTDFNGDVRA